MVLGLSMRKKKASEPPKPVRASPSLPDIRAQSLVWPESLVDLPSYNTAAVPPPTRGQTGPAPIASMYASPPSAFNRTPSLPARRSSIGRRPRAPAPFNLMVAGPRGVGKSALLRLLLQMSDPPSQLDLPARPTRMLATSTVELPGPERLVLTVIDTPGLDFSDGAELELEKSVTTLVRYVDSQYAETLGEESKVVRQSKGDHHVHLCLYLIDPASIQSSSQRQRAHNHLRSSRSFSAVNRSDTPDSSSHDSDYDSDEDDTLGLAPSEIRAIQRLARRTNVLPVIARGDTLTDTRLDRVRKAVRRDLTRAGVDMKIFGIGEEMERGRTESKVTPSMFKAQAEDESDEERKVIKIRSTRQPSRARASQDQQDVPDVPRLDPSASTAESPVSPVNGAGADVHVIPKVNDSTLALMFPLVVIAPDVPKPKRGAKAKGANGADMTNAERAVSVSPDMPGTPVAITTDDPDLPSAELAAGFGPRAEGSPNGNGNGIGRVVGSPAGRTPSAYALPPSSWRPGGSASLPSAFQGQGGASPSSATSAGAGSRTYPRGVFTRKYRWGTIDVLDPAHCDVGVLRGVVLGSHMKALKTHTREVMYERFRTEKLLARRATQNITPEQRSRLMKGLDP